MSFTFSNFVFGSLGNDTLQGTDGRDWLFGLSGDDTIAAGAGNDRVFAGRGDDVIDAGVGDDHIFGGGGFDTAVFSGLSTDYSITSSGSFFRSFTVTGDDGSDRLFGVEALYFGGDDRTIFIDGRNNDPFAVGDAVSVSEDGPTIIDAANLLANDDDFEGGALALTGVTGAFVSLLDGNVVFDAGETFQSLGANETAEVTFDYTVEDGEGGAGTGTVTVTIEGANDAPVLVVPGTVTVEENTLAVAQAAATDVDGDTITFGLSGADAGLFSISDTGAITFDAAPDFEAPLDADGDNVYDVTVEASDGTTLTSEDISITVSDVEEMPALEARINEIHYDNSGADTGEFVEIRVAAGTDPARLTLELYNGNGGGAYGTFALPEGPSGSDGSFDYYVIDTPGLQNGGPDGLALIGDGAVLEFLSYEGSFEATGGTALGLTSTDIGVSEPSSTPIGLSLQRNADGTWRAPSGETRGATNEASEAPQLVISEVMQNPDAVFDSNGEYFEIYNAGTAAVDINGWTVSDNDSDSFVIDNGGPLTIAPGSYLVLGNNADISTNGGVPVDYEYSGMSLSNGADEIVLTTPAGDEIDRIEWDGGLNWPDPTGAAMELADLTADNNDGANWTTAVESFGDGDLGTPGAPNGGVIVPPPGETVLISSVQGSGEVAARFGEVVTVSAIVTYVVGNGFYLQEEDTDADGDAATSEGIFVFAAGLDLPDLGDQVSVTGTVDEFFDLTQIDTVSDITVVSSGNPLPTAVQIGLSPETAPDFEALEGMRVEVTSGTDDPLTVIENFNFDRFGQITVSAGTQTQPTQVFDAQIEADEVAALQEANLNNRLLIDDGLSSQNPDGFEFVPASVGDNGNGFLDSSDTFGAEGPTLRLGAEITNAPSGVLSFGFGEYQLLIENRLEIDPATNEGARQATPDEVGGTVQVAGFNVLNYFTTLNGGTGPTGDVGVRGARTEEDLNRQTEKLVEAILGTGAEVLALQELENNGFGADSAIAALVEALNAKAAAQGTGQVFAFVDPTDPTDPDEDGFIGTDAITTGLIYDSTAVNLITADYHAFEEASAADTLATAQVLSDGLGSNELSDNQRNRPVVAAEFEDAETGVAFTVASVHFKSKGDSGLQSLAEAAQDALDSGTTAITQADLDALLTDPNFDQGNGQAFWNQVRADAASETNDWLRTAFGGTGTDDFVILGDYNAYSNEDPVQALTDDAFYTDLLAEFVGVENAYSFVFDGQQGALDHAVASDTLADLVTGLTEWHINAEEPDLLNYSSRFTDPGFFSPDVFASSDHDPIILGLDTSGDTPLV
ncbi:MAG: ExeM/NucH family extracellular endonuclease [Pseudomonadota bacterium]